LTFINEYAIIVSCKLKKGNFASQPRT